MFTETLLEEVSTTFILETRKQMTEQVVLLRSQLHVKGVDVTENCFLCISLQSVLPLRTELGSKLKAACLWKCS